MISTNRYRIGFDIGGTFTDFILLDTQRNDIRLHKCLTTPHDPSIGALEGLTELLHAAQLTLSDIGDVVHGTTLVTNALIERSGARLGLITTRGFRDILEMGTEQRYDIYDLFLQFPDPLVPRRHRLEVAERMDRDGNVLTPLDAAEVRATAQRLVANGIEAIAICFLHAYRNPAHERHAAEIVRAAFPDIAVSISSDVVAELWEYQRCNTTCANAYVQPLMGRYIAKLERELHARGFRGELRFMHSAGGLLSPETARDFPIRMLESGPAGGGPRHRVLRCRRRQAGCDLIRHGRHHGEGLPDRERTRRDRTDDGSGARAPLQERLRPADQGAGDRHDRDRRRWRLGRRDRRGGAAARRPAFRRRRSGAGVLRARRHGTHGDRRQSAAGLLRSRLLPRRPHGAGSRCGGARAGESGRKARPRRDRHGVGHPPHGGGEHGRRGAHPHRGEGQGPARLRHGGLRRRGPRACRRGGARTRRETGADPAGVRCGLGIRASSPHRCRSSRYAAIRCGSMHRVRRQPSMRSCEN